MIKDYLRQSRIGRRAAVVVSAVLLPLVLVGVVASPALAAGKPTGEFKNFTLCPMKHTPAAEVCLYAKTSSGEVKIGKTAVPIENPIYLQGGFYIGEENEEFVDVFINAEGGETLSKAAQNVPGGLLEIFPPEFLIEPFKKLFEEYIVNKGPTGVTATTELVGAVKYNEGNLLNGNSEPALTLPVRVHLGNTFLGEDCYIGSSSNPITLKLITGTTSPPKPNTPISGKVGEITFKDKDNLVVVTGNKLVDNSFSVPVAEGCVNYIPWWLGGEIISAIADEIVDKKLGLKSEPGNNTAILNNTLEKTGPKQVKESE
jgi:hypothetical protein